MPDIPVRKRLRTLTTALAAAAAVVAAVAAWRARPQGTAPNLDVYDYRDTRKLVALTARAAAAIEAEGEDAFERFRRRPEAWSLGENSYLYVYDFDNVNLYHGGYPEFRGRNLTSMTDLLGKHPGPLIVDQIENHHDLNPHGWVHYLWVPPGALNGVWKASCNFPVTFPDGRRGYVGCGFDYPHQEREFYRIVVDEAAELISREGNAALDLIKSPAGPFVIHDSRVFVILGDGTTIIDPGLDLKESRNLLSYRDESGNRPLAMLAGRLEEEDRAWVVMRSRDSRGERAEKKGIYGRKAVLNGREVIVGAICPLPRPAWMG
ncbi:MAG TPA: cache domain-containing protein [bacterium]|nr:cache domain-containing protein [bacterium]HPJ71635.1 cache domain-containing protein [bacterium]HPQ65234.1 cache domain-containing protein [bacterium]